MRNTNRARMVLMLVFLLLLPAMANASSGTGETWVSLGLEAAYGFRSAPNSATIVTLATTGQELFNADSFSFGGELGGDLRVNVGFAGGWRFEARYGAFSEFSDDPLLPAPGATYRYGPTGVSGALSAQWDYESEFQQGEIDFGYALEEWVTLHGGVRWVRIDEDLPVLLSSSTFAAIIQNDTSNDLLGLQFGANFRVWNTASTHGNIDVVAGALRNSAEGSAVLQNPVGNFTHDLDDSDTMTSPMAEVEFRVSWTLTPHWSLQFGLDALWIDKLALASSQPETSVFLPAPSSFTLNTEGDVLYTDAFFGFDVRF